VKLALWQTVGVPGDVAANLAALEDAAHAAAAAGASLLLTPECWLCGYNVGAAIAELAQSREGAAAVQIADCAQRHRIAIAYGYAERDLRTREVFNSVQVIAAAGVSLSNYRKNHLFGAMERAAFRAGDAFVAPFRLGDFSVGLLICYDVEFPEAVRALKLMGTELILVPTATTDEYASVPGCIVPARAIENQLLIAYCNHAGVENGMRFLGGSCLVGADGAVIASAGCTDALLVAQLDRTTLTAGSALYPYLADRRPELYSMLVRK
jgi:predicted amidohydrolase